MRRPRWCTKAFTSGTSQILDGRSGPHVIGDVVDEIDQAGWVRRSTRTPTATSGPPTLDPHQGPHQGGAAHQRSEDEAGNDAIGPNHHPHVQDDEGQEDGRGEHIKTDQEGNRDGRPPSEGAILGHARSAHCCRSSGQQHGVWFAHGDPEPPLAWLSVFGKDAHGDEPGLNVAPAKRFPGDGLRPLEPGRGLETVAGYAHAGDIHRLSAGHPVGDLPAEPRLDHARRGPREGVEDSAVTVFPLTADPGSRH